MLIIDDLLLLPLKGLIGIFKQIQKQADQELGDRGKLREKLLEAQILFEVDKITEEEYLKREKEIMVRLNALEEGGEEEEEGEEGEEGSSEKHVSSEVLPPSEFPFMSGKERKISKD